MVLLNRVWIVSLMLVTMLLVFMMMDIKRVQAQGSVTVKEGETLDSIAKRYGSTQEKWQKVNRLESRFLTVGQTLNIVFPYRVVAGDELTYLAAKYNTTPFSIKQLNHMDQDRLTAGEIISIPVNVKTKEATQPQAAKAEEKKESTTVAKKEEKVSKQTKKEEVSKPKQEKVKNSGKKQIQMKATAYNIEGNEQWGDLTHIGTKVRAGVVAVDPKVIPLGTKLYVSGYDSPFLPKGGFVAVAEDTGGAIKGNRIDIYIDAPSPQISQFGIQNVQVQIIE